MKVKICGITHPEDAAYAVQEGADQIGIIFAPSSKRYVSLPEALAIVDIILQGGAEPVGVFVDESVDQILSICQATGIKTVQLHGAVSPASLTALQEHVSVIYAVYVDAHGMTSLPQNFPEGAILLFDTLGSGSGRTFHWNTFSPPKTAPWILAGGLTPSNVSTAIALLNPNGVDVASGVEYAHSTRKDPHLVRSFITIAKQSQKKPMNHPYAFGGQFMPEILMTPIQILSEQWNVLKNHNEFNKELNHLLKNYAGRPTPLTEVKNFAQAIDGPRIFLKREDLLHTGAHKINNALGQCLLAKYMGKTRIIAETGAGQHGVATATACAHLGLECVVYMGVTDMKRQQPNVEKMQLLGATVVPVTQGAATLKDAINEALRDWSSHYDSSHYCLGSALGPAPYPDMVRTFQSIISLEVQEQIHALTQQAPDLLIACVGGGSNAIGFFHHFIQDPNIDLVGVEAGGVGTKPGEHAARFAGGSPGVLHGCYTYLLQTPEGQILPTHSISAGLDYPAIGPDHSTLYESGRVTYTTVTDTEALNAFHLLARSEGIIPALESSHALAYLIKRAPSLDKNSIVIVNLSGRGDKDLAQVLAHGGDAL